MSDARHEARDARFDDAVDRAVREMLDVEPRADLRARVMARIEEPHVASGFDASHVASAFRRKFWLIGAPIAAAAIIILAVVIARRDAAGPALAPTAPPSIAQATPPPAPVTSAQTSPDSTPRTVTPDDRQWVVEPPREVQRVASATARDSRLAVAATVAEAQSGSSDGVEPLGEIAPISVAAISPRSISSPPIQISPLGAITELQVAPLTPPEGRH